MNYSLFLTEVKLQHNSSCGLILEGSADRFPKSVYWYNTLRKYLRRRDDPAGRLYKNYPCDFIPARAEVNCK